MIYLNFHDYLYNSSTSLKIQIQPKESMIFLTSKPGQNFFVDRIQSLGKQLFKEKWEWRIEQKTERRRFNCSRYGD